MPCSRGCPQRFQTSAGGLRVLGLLNTTHTLRKMASSHITVFVKPLFGDTLAVEVDPTLGLQGVADKLSLEDSKNFPPALTRVFFVDPDSDTLTTDSLLGVVISDELAQRLLSKSEITLPGTNASYEGHYIQWMVRLENGSTAHIYVRNGIIGIQINITVDSHYIVAPMSGYKCIEDAIYRHNAYYGTESTRHVSLRDEYFISKLLQAYPWYKPYLNDPRVDENDNDHLILRSFYPGYQPANRDRLVFCECGHVVKASSMKQHLATKVKHPNGEKDGKDFIALVDSYLETHYQNGELVSF